jgi:riboflavin kinase/FMN adenylyltransferase
LSQKKSPIRSIAVGSFDGIHTAHKKLIDQADAVAVIDRGPGYLTPGYKRSWYTDKPLFFYFLDTIRTLGTSEFVTKLRADFPSLEKIVIGYDFHFGRDRSGDANRLAELFSAQVVIVDEVIIDGISVHSGVIRAYLQQGDITMANTLLGRRYMIDGIVTRGQGLGRQELVPTINIKTINYQLPKEGVYRTRTKIDKEWLPSVSFIGHRITTDGSFAVETHIIDRQVDIAPYRASIEFTDKLRDNIRFENLAQLKKQITKDIDQARNWSQK